MGRGDDHKEPSETKGARNRRRNQAVLLLPAGAGHGPRGVRRPSGSSPCAQAGPAQQPQRGEKGSPWGSSQETRGRERQRSQGVIKLRSLGGGAGGAYRPVYLELLARDERYRREREGVITGIERAIDLVELEEEELEQQVLSLQASPQPESPAPRKTPQNVQSTGGGEKLLEDDNDKRDDMNEIKHGGSSNQEGEGGLYDQAYKLDNLL